MPRRHAAASPGLPAWACLFCLYVIYVLFGVFDLCVYCLYVLFMTSVVIVYCFICLLIAGLGMRMHEAVEREDVRAEPPPPHPAEPVWGLLWGLEQRCFFVLVLLIVSFKGCKSNLGPRLCGVLFASCLPSWCRFIWRGPSKAHPNAPASRTSNHPAPGAVALSSVGWHYLSNATCLIRPHLSYELFIVSRITVTCYIIRRFWRTHALD